MAKITKEDLDKSNSEFAAAFSEEDQGPADMNEDQAFGIDPEVAEGAEGEIDAVVVVDDKGAMTEKVEDQVADVTAEAEADKANAAANDTGSAPIDTAAEEGPTDPKEIQQERSWRGRLEARERELAAREKALAEKASGTAKPEDQAAEGADALEQVADAAEAAGDLEKAEAAEAAAEAVESGAMSFDQAVKALAEDFGDEFVKMIEAVAAKAAADAATKTAEGRVGELGKTLEEVIAHIGDSQARAHFEAIADAHPDFAEIKDKPEFQEFLAGYENGEQIAKEGSARQIIKMLSAFKDGAKAEPEATAAEEQAPGTAVATAPAEPVNDSALDAAEGVRSSGGMQLPDEPAASNDYAAAWAEA